MLRQILMGEIHGTSTMLVETQTSAATQENRAAISRLEAENASLRAYLDRVLVLLNNELPEPAEPEATDVPAPAPSPVGSVEPSPSQLLRWADVDRRIKRTEETLEDLIWLVTRLEQETAAKLKA